MEGGAQTGGETGGGELRCGMCVVRTGWGEVGATCALKPFLPSAGLLWGRDAETSGSPRLHLTLHFIAARRRSRLQLACHRRCYAAASATPSALQGPRMPRSPSRPPRTSRRRQSGRPGLPCVPLILSNPPTPPRRCLALPAALRLLPPPPRLRGRPAQPQPLAGDGPRNRFRTRHQKPFQLRLPTPIKKRPPLD